MSGAIGMLFYDRRQSLQHFKYKGDENAIKQRAFGRKKK